MPSNSGTKLLAIYIGHLENAARLLEKLPNKFYRDEWANKTIHEQKRKLEELADEAEKIRDFLPEEKK